MCNTCLGFGLSLLLALCVTGSVASQFPSITYSFACCFEDATFSLDTSIFDAALVIDYVSYTA